MPKVLSRFEFWDCIFIGLFNALGNLCIVLGFKYAAISHTNPSEMTAILNMNAIYSLILGVFYLKEWIKLLQILGSVLVIGSIIMISQENSISETNSDQK